MCVCVCVWGGGDVMIKSGCDGFRHKKLGPQCFYPRFITCSTDVGKAWQLSCVGRMYLTSVSNSVVRRKGGLTEEQEFQPCILHSQQEAVLFPHRKYFCFQFLNL